MKITDAELVIIMAHEQGCSYYVGEGDDLCGQEQCECLRVVRALREAIETPKIERLHSAIENFADEKNWSDRPGCLQWMGKRHAIEYAQSVLSDITFEDQI